MKTGGIALIVWMVTLSIGIVDCCISMAPDRAYRLASDRYRALALKCDGSPCHRPAFGGAHPLDVDVLHGGPDRCVEHPVSVIDRAYRDHWPVCRRRRIAGPVPHRYLLRDRIRRYPAAIYRRAPRSFFRKGIGRRTAGVIFFGGSLGGYLYGLTRSYTLAFLIGVAVILVNLVIIGYLILRLRLRSVRAGLI